MAKYPADRFEESAPMSEPHEHQPVSQASLRHPRRSRLVAGVLGVAAVVVGTLLGLSPTSTRDAVRLVDDPYRLAPTDSAAVRCIPASDDLGRSPFADAKQNACGIVRSRWFLLLAVLVTVSVLAVLIVVWPPSGQRLGPWRLRRLAVIPLLPLLLAGALFTAVIGWLTLGTPPPTAPSAQLADPFGAGAPVEVVFAVDIMGPPSVSIETAPLGITRYVLVAKCFLTGLA
jgi:hypothetical protein